VAAAQPFLQLMGADRRSAAAVAWGVRMAGARDAALGAGLLAATRSGGDVRRWLLAGLVSDAADATFLTQAARRGAAPLPALAGAGAALGGATAGALALRGTR
jgi:hypothetical protein